MKITIETPTQEEPERVFNHFKRFCIENLQEFKLNIKGTELEFEQKKGQIPTTKVVGL